MKKKAKQSVDEKINKLSINNKFWFEQIRKEISALEDQILETFEVLV